TVVRQAQALLELGQERLGVAAIRVLHPVAAKNQHGQLGQVVTGEVIQLAAGQHLAHRGESVTVEPRAVSDAHDAARPRGFRTTSHTRPPLRWDCRWGSPTNREVSIAGLRHLVIPALPPDEARPRYCTPAR